MKNRSPYIIPNQKIEFIHSADWMIMTLSDFFSWIKCPNILDLNPVEGRFSLLSGEPGFVYRSNDLDFSLSREEMIRFGRHSLLDHEVAFLIDYFGDPVPFEWGQFFYPRMYK